jgi:hypothetical protein
MVHLQSLSKYIYLMVLKVGSKYLIDSATESNHESQVKSPFDIFEAKSTIVQNVLYFSI